MRTRGKNKTFGFLFYGWCQRVRLAYFSHSHSTRILFHMDFFLIIFPQLHLHRNGSTDCWRRIRRNTKNHRRVPERRVMTKKSTLLMIAMMGAKKKILGNNIINIIFACTHVTHTIVRVRAWTTWVVFRIEIQTIKSFNLKRTDPFALQRPFLDHRHNALRPQSATFLDLATLSDRRLCWSSYSLNGVAHRLPTCWRRPFCFPLPDLCGCSFAVLYRFL